MKLRHGFVSNSSSSSFVLRFPKKVDSPEELKVLLNWDAFKEAVLDGADVVDLTYDSEYQSQLALVDRDFLSNLLWQIIKGFRSYIGSFTTYYGKTLKNQKQLFSYLFYDDDFMSFKEVMQSLGARKMKDLDFMVLGNDADYPCDITEFEWYLLYKYEYVLPVLFDNAIEQDQH